MSRSIEAESEASTARARALAVKHAAQHRYLPGAVFPYQRDAYRETYRAHVKPRRVGRPRKCDLDGKYSSGRVGQSSSSAVVLPADAVARRGVAGRAPSRSTESPAGVFP